MIPASPINPNIHSLIPVNQVSSEWIAQTKKALTKTDVQPNDLLQVLSKNKGLRECYCKNAGVSEGYSVGQHTLMVLEIAQRYRESLINQVERNGVSWNEFLLFLALHDIGKGSAKENESEMWGTSLSFKEAELKNTQEILKTVMQQLEIDSKKITLFTKMLEYDTQGLLLKGDIHEDEAFDNILELADNCNFDPCAFYELFEVFHRVDAASYPSLYQSIFETKGGQLNHIPANQNKVDQLHNRLTQSIKGEMTFELLLAKIKNGDTEDVTKLFLENLSSLNQYLNRMHKKMLLSTGSNQDQESFRRVKRGFRDLFLYFAGTCQDLDSLKRFYDQQCETSLGKKNFGFFPGIKDTMFDLLFKKTSKSYPSEHREQFESTFDKFQDELMNFRKNYLCRYSLPKVEKSIRTNAEDPAAISLDRSSPHFKLLTTTFCHGTNATILPNLFKTGFQLTPVARLFKAGIVPFSGELAEGATELGINSYKISGTSLDDSSRAASYASNTKFHTNKTSEETFILSFLDKWEKVHADPEFRSFKSEYDVTGAASFPRLSTAILRLRALDPDLYKSIESRLNILCKRLDADFVKFKESVCYKSKMPKAEDIDGTLGYTYHDYYWWGSFKNTEGGIASLKKALSSKIVVPEGLDEYIKNPFPIIFSSRTIHTVPQNVQSPSERCAQKACLLGKDIQTMFVKKDDIEKAKSFLDKNHLAACVAVLPIDVLTKAMELNRDASPYFADYISRKKLRFIRFCRT